MLSLSKTHHYKTYPRLKRFCVWWCSVTAPAYKSIPPNACSRHINSAYWHHNTERYKWWRVEIENRKWTEENFSLKAGNVCVSPLNQQNEPLPEQPTATLSHLITVGLIIVLQRRWIWKYSWGRLRSDCGPHTFCFTDRSYLLNTLSVFSIFTLNPSILVFGKTLEQNKPRKVFTCSIYLVETGNMKWIIIIKTLISCMLQEKIET